MNSKLRSLIVVVPALSGLLVPLTPASGEEKPTTCTAPVVAEFIPGLSSEPSRGSYYVSSDGPMTCDGPVQGEMQTGPGDYQSAGRIGTKDPDSCTDGGEGWGSNRLVVPTATGDKIIRSAFTFVYGGVENQLFSGTWEGDYTSGTLRMTQATKGDCVTAPLQEGKFELVFTIHEYQGPTGASEG
jgi:hypothetical protein